MVKKKTAVAHIPVPVGNLSGGTNCMYRYKYTAVATAVHVDLHVHHVVDLLTNATCT
jgi:hypothetical protein